MFSREQLITAVRHFQPGPSSRNPKAKRENICFGVILGKCELFQNLNSQVVKRLHFSSHLHSVIQHNISVGVQLYCAALAKGRIASRRCRQMAASVPFRSPRELIDFHATPAQIAESESTSRRHAFVSSLWVFFYILIH